MIKYQKKPVLMLAHEPLYIYREATDKHNEVTVIKATYVMPINNILMGGSMAMCPNILLATHQAAEGFQDVEFEFNKNVQSPAFIITIKAKTERRGNDEPDQELANKIVLAKANSKACIFANRVLKSIHDYYRKEIHKMYSIRDKFDGFAARELSYIQKV